MANAIKTVGKVTERMPVLGQPSSCSNESPIKSTEEISAIYDELEKSPCSNYSEFMALLQNAKILPQTLFERLRKKKALELMDGLLNKKYPSTPQDKRPSYEWPASFAGGDQAFNQQMLNKFMGLIGYESPHNTNEKPNLIPGMLVEGIIPIPYDETVDTRKAYDLKALIDDQYRFGICPVTTGFKDPENLVIEDHHPLHQELIERTDSFINHDLRHGQIVMNYFYKKYKLSNSIKFEHLLNCMNSFLGGHEYNNGQKALLPKPKKSDQDDLLKRQVLYHYFHENNELSVRSDSLPDFVLETLAGPKKSKYSIKNIVKDQNLCFELGADYLEFFDKSPMGQYLKSVGDNSVLLSNPIYIVRQIMFLNLDSARLTGRRAQIMDGPQLVCS